MKISRCVFAFFMLAGCSEAPEGELSYYCGDTIRKTIDHSSAVVYGADTPAPQLKNVFPITEGTLAEMSIGDRKMLSLIAINGEGKIFNERCSELCGPDDAMSVISKCRTTPGCQIVGGVKNFTFYPFYTTDRNGGHICLRKED